MWTRLKATADRLQRDVKVYRLVLADDRVPKPVKWLLGLAVGYALSPVDLIPDFIPVVGYVDDVLIVPALLLLARRLTPTDVFEECRKRAFEESGRVLSSELPVA